MLWEAQYAIVGQDQTGSPRHMFIRTVMDALVRMMEGKFMRAHSAYPALGPSSPPKCDVLNSTKMIIISCAFGSVGSLYEYELILDRRSPDLSLLEGVIPMFKFLRKNANLN